MSSSIPIVRQIAWWAVLVQVCLMGFLIFLYTLLQSNDPVFLAMVSYLSLSVLLRLGVPKHHRKGMELIKQQRFHDAIPYFTESYQFFTRHLWIDRYRFITMLSASKITYREMALCNIAFCHSQTEQGQLAIQYYQQVLQQFPGSAIATTALRMLQSVGVTRIE